MTDLPLPAVLPLARRPRRKLCPGGMARELPRHRLIDHRRPLQTNRAARRSCPAVASRNLSTHATQAAAAGARLNAGVYDHGYGHR